MADVGISFAPTSSVGRSASGPSVSPTQDAIRLLSFRLPTVLGASAAAPAALLGGPTLQGAQMANPMAANWLRMLFGNLSAMGGTMPSPQMPNVGGEAFGGSGFSGSAGLPASISLSQGDRSVAPDIVNENMPPSPTNPATGNQFVDFGVNADVRGGGRQY